MQEMIDMPEILTAEDAIRYLGLDRDPHDRDPRERLRNLVRRQGLPVVKAGKYIAFRRSALDAWLERKEDGRGRGLSR